MLNNKTGSVHAVTGTAQGLVDSATPKVRSVPQGSTRALPGGLSGGLPVVGQLGQGNSLPVLGQAEGLSQVTSGLPVHAAPLG